MYVDIWTGYHGVAEFLTTFLSLGFITLKVLSTTRTMLSKLIIPLVCLFITISSLVQSHELPFHRRDHGSKRFLKNRQVLGDVAQNPPANSGSQTATSHSTVLDTPSVRPFPSYKGLHLTCMHTDLIDICSLYHLYHLYHPRHRHLYHFRFHFRRHRL